MITRYIVQALYTEQKPPQTRSNSWSKMTRSKRGPFSAPLGPASSTLAAKPHSKSAACSAASAAADAAVAASKEAAKAAAAAAVRLTPPSSAAAGQPDRALRFAPLRCTDVHDPRRFLLRKNLRRNRARAFPRLRGETSCPFEGPQTDRQHCRGRSRAKF